VHLTVAYITSRKNPCDKWFLRSFGTQLLAQGKPDCCLVFVDFHGNKTSISNGTKWPIICVKPKPTPWQGEHRLADHNAFAASNARNTALCLAPDGYIVFVDDVSVLCPGWLIAVQDAMNNRRIVCGAYRKVNELTVDKNGTITHFKDFPAGHDSRWQDGRKGPIPCEAQWLFGCSFAAPVETLLSVNGFDECLDGLSFEDVCLGLRLEKAGHQLWYDQRMLTFESEEAHHGEGEKFKRHNRPIEGHKDCAWEMLDWIKNNPPQSRGTPDLRKIRADIFKGKPFPMHSGFFIWPDGKNLLGQ